MEEESFYTWFRTSWKRWVPASATFTLPPLSWFAQAQLALDWKWLFPSTLALQVIVILVIIGVIKRPDSEESYARASLAAQQFHDCWKTTWFLWLILYVAMAINSGLVTLDASIYLASGKGEAFAGASLNALNNSVSIAFFMCYKILAERTIEGQGESRHKIELPWHLGIGLVVVLAATETVAILADWAYLPIFGWVSSIAAGLAIAIVVGRLDSKYFGIPVAVIIGLYLYAVIQPGWAQFDENTAVPLTLVNLALALKVLFFLVIKWTMDTGRFHYYADRMGPLIDEIQLERQEFIEKFSRHLRPVTKKKKTRTKKR